MENTINNQIVPARPEDDDNKTDITEISSIHTTEVSDMSDIDSVSCSGCISLHDLHNDVRRLEKVVSELQQEVKMLTSKLKTIEQIPKREIPPTSDKPKPAPRNLLPQPSTSTTPKRAYINPNSKPILVAGPKPNKSILEEVNNFLDPVPLFRTKLNYHTFQISGQDHDPTFRCTLSRAKLTTVATALTKRDAENDAAGKMIKLLIKDADIPVSILGGWKRDLTRENIESNPGPMFMGAYHFTIDAENATSRSIIDTELAGARKVHYKYVMSLYNTTTYTFTVQMQIVDPNDEQQWWEHFFHIAPGVNHVTVDTTDAYSFEDQNPWLTFKVEALHKADSVFIDVLVNLYYDPIGPQIVSSGDLPLWTASYKPVKNIAKPKTPKRKRKAAIEPPSVVEGSAVDDLTREGVEENPGPECLLGKLPTYDTNVETNMVMELLALEGLSLPKEEKTNETCDTSYLKQHIVASTKLEGKVGGYFNLVAMLSGLETHNRFAVLEDLNSGDFDTIEQLNDRCEETREKDKDQATKKTANKDLTVELENTKGKDRKPKNKKDDKEKLTPRQNYEHMMLRLEKMFVPLATDDFYLKSRKLMSFVSWAYFKQSRRKLVQSLSDKVWGLEWELTPSFDQYQSAIYAHIYNINLNSLIYELVQLDNKLDRYIANVESSILELTGDNGAVEAATALHNKSMHMYNGNPVVSRTMEDIMEAKKFMNFMGANSSVVGTVSELESLLANSYSGSNIASSALRNQDTWRSNLVSAAYAAIQNAALPLPHTPNWPRQIRPLVAGAPVNSANRISLQSVFAGEYFANALELSDLGKALTLARDSSTSSVWRPGSTSIFGFPMFDAITMIAVPSLKGFSAECMCLKYCMLHSVYAQFNGSAFIPASIYSAIDTRTVATAANPQLTYGGSAIFGEDCSAQVARPAGNVFPCNGQGGTIQFYAQAGDVPARLKGNIVYIPSTMLNACGANYSQALALAIQGWAPAPAGFYGVTQATTDLAGGNPHNTNFLINNSAVAVPGLMDIAVILPLKTATAVPPNAAGIQAVCDITPMAGPALAGTLAANQVLLFSSAAAQNAYNLNDYLATWALSYDITLISNMLLAISTISNISQDLNAMQDINVAVSHLFPSLISSDLANTTDFAANSAFQFFAGQANCNLPPTAAANFPIVGGIPNCYSIFQTDPIAWNKLVLGLVQPPQPLTMTPLPEWIGNPKALYWELLHSLRIAATYAIWFWKFGMSADALQNAYNNTNVSAQNKMVMGMYTSTIPVHGTFAPAMFGTALRRLYENLTDRSPCITTLTLPGKVMHITIFDRTMPYFNFMTVRNAAGLPLTSNGPCNIVDLWVGLLSNDLPKGAMPFPGPSGGKHALRAFGTESGLKPYRNLNGGALVGPYMDNEQYGFFETNKLPDFSDESLFNIRLWATDPNVQVITTNGNAVVNVVPGNQCIKQRPAPILAGNVRSGTLVDANTLSNAFIDTNNLVQLYVLPQAVATPYMQSANGTANLLRAAWLGYGNVLKPALYFDGGGPAWFDALPQADFTKAASTQQNAEATLLSTEQQIPTTSVLPFENPVTTTVGNQE